MDTKELLQRITTITEEMTNLRVSYSKLEGHLAEAKFWLAQGGASEESKNETENESIGEKQNGEADNEAKG